MNQHGIFKKWLWAGVMGILTILLCLIVSDDLLGLNSPPARSQIGHYVFWVSLIGLPLLFYKFVSWRYTLLNIPLYFLLYFPAYELCGLKHTHLFLQTSGFISFPVWFGAILVTGNVKKCAVGKYPKSEKPVRQSGGLLCLRPLPVLHRRQSQRVARIDPNAVVVDKNIAENDRFDLFSR